MSWSRGQLQKCTFSLPKWVQNTHWAPHSPPECWISSTCQWFRYNIKYLAFRWGIQGFKLSGKLIGRVWGGFARGRPYICTKFKINPPWTEKFDRCVINRQRSGYLESFERLLIHITSEHVHQNIVRLQSCADCCSHCRILRSKSIALISKPTTVDRKSVP